MEPSEGEMGPTAGPRWALKRGTNVETTAVVGMTACMTAVTAVTACILKRGTGVETTAVVAGNSRAPGASRATDDCSLLIFTPPASRQVVNTAVRRRYLCLFSYLSSVQDWHIIDAMATTLRCL